jgi:hypothetical protein
MRWRDRATDDRVEVGLGERVHGSVGAGRERDRRLVRRLEERVGTAAETACSAAGVPDHRQRSPGRARTSRPTAGEDSDAEVRRGPTDGRVRNLPRGGINRVAVLIVVRVCAAEVVGDVAGVQSEGAPGEGDDARRERPAALGAAVGGESGDGVIRGVLLGNIGGGNLGVDVADGRIRVVRRPPRGIVVGRRNLRRGKDRRRR